MASWENRGVVVPERGPDMSLEDALPGDGVKLRGLARDLKILTTDDGFRISDQLLGLQIEHAVGNLDNDLLLLLVVELHFEFGELDLPLVELAGNLSREVDGEVSLLVILGNLDPLDRLSHGNR